MSAYLNSCLTPKPLERTKANAPNQPLAVTVSSLTPSTASLTTNWAFGVGIALRGFSFAPNRTLPLSPGADSEWSVVEAVSLGPIRNLLANR